MDYEEAYRRFASFLHFFEFVQKEYYEPDFDIERYKEEIEKMELKLPKNKKELTFLLREFPRIFDIIEQIYQLKRFTNAHYLNFLFDVKLLNRSNWDEVFEYLKKNMLKDKGFEDIFISELQRAGLDEKDVHIDSEEKLMIMNVIKRCVAKYSYRIANDTTKSQKHRQKLHRKIKNMPDVADRIAGYLFRNRDFADFFQSIKPRKYLRVKRIPVDPKSFSGNYGLYIIENFLEKEGIPKVTKYLIRGNSSKKPITINEENFQGLDIPTGWSYAPELFIEGITKRTSGKLKKFDYILFKDGIPEVCIETNFYSTTGTKIGINEDEYRALNEDMRKSPLQFWWTTDGNYWLTNDGKERYIRCLKDHNMNVYNYNQFRNKIKDLK